MQSAQPELTALAALKPTRLEPAFGRALTHALQSQGTQVPAQVVALLQSLATDTAPSPSPLPPSNSASDARANLLAQLQLLLQPLGWALHSGSPRRDLPAHAEHPAQPWGSIWLGAGIEGTPQLWQRSAAVGWQRLWPSAQPETAATATAAVTQPTTTPAPIASPDPGAALPAAPAVPPPGSGWLLVPQGLPQLEHAGSGTAGAGGAGEGTGAGSAAASASGAHSSYWTWVSALLQGRLGGIVLASTLINFSFILLPLFSMLVYDKVVYNGVFETLWSLAIGVALFTALEMLLRQLRTRQVERLALILDERVDRQLFGSLLRPTGRAGSHPGAAARFLTLYRDLGGARDFFSANYLLALADMPFVLVIWAIIGFIAWPLLLVALAWTALYVWWGMRLKGHTLRVSQAATLAQTHKQAVMTDALSSLDLLRTSHAGGKLFGRFLTLASEQSLRNANSRELMQSQMHAQQIVYVGSFVSLLVVGSYLVFDQVTTSGALVAVSMLAGRTLGLVGQALQTLGRWQELQTALASLTPYLQSAPVQAASTSFRRAPRDMQGRIALVQLGHQYAQGAPVLHDINLRIAPGERVGLVGRPGSGKSTLVRLLAGAMQPSAGEVRVDEVALTAYDMADRFIWLSFKPQEPTLIAGSVEDNILIGLPDNANHAQRMEALRRGLYFSGLDKDLQAGYLSLGHMVEEYGANLSGGQRQKVALARTLALPSKLVVLDEPGNGLDPESEQLLVQRLAQLQGVTLIVVSHSLQMLRLTQRVLALDQGRVVADGPTGQIVKAV